MKSKHYGGRPKPSPTRRPPPKASTFIASPHQQNEVNGRANAADSIDPETSIESGDFDNDDENGGVGTQCALSPERDLSMKEEYLDLDSLDRRTCIKCNVRDGQVLFCSEMRCPVAIHEKCLGCKPQFDGLGNFYCPYCSYKQALEKTWKLRRKVVVAKKALSKFLGNSALVGNQEQQRDGGNKRKKSDVLSHAVDDDSGIRVNGLNVAEVQSHYLGVEEDRPTGSDSAAQMGCHEQDGMILDYGVRPNTSAANCNDFVVSEGEGPMAGSEMHPIPASKEKSGETWVHEMHSSEMVEDEQPEQAENLGPKDDSKKNEGILEDNKEAENLNISSAEGDTIVDGAVNASNGAVNDVVGVFEEKNCREDDEEQIQLKDLNGKSYSVGLAKKDIIEVEPLSCYLGEETTENGEVNRPNGVNLGSSLYKKNKGRRQGIYMEDREAKEHMQPEDADGHSNASGSDSEDIGKAGHLHSHDETRACAPSDELNEGAIGTAGEEDEQHMQPEDLDRPANVNGISEIEQHMQPEDLDRPANVNGISEIDILDTETIRKTRFKTKAQRKTNLLRDDSSRQLSFQLRKKPLLKQADIVEENAENLYKKTRILEKSPESVKQITSSPFVDAKRKRFFWTAEEEAVLKKGVEQFSVQANKNMPWRKILDFGSSVFHSTRTPSDLKDKWRNLMAKAPSNN